MNNYSDHYKPIFKIWAFYKPIVFIRHPNDLKTILSSIHNNEKSYIYEVLQPWLGTGLLTSGGAKWHSRRKMLTHSFHFNILKQFAINLIEEGENMTNSLINIGGPTVKDLMPLIGEHTLNTICETAMGCSLRDLGEFQKLYREAIHQIGEIIIYRFRRQWLYNDWIFSLTSKGKEQTKILKILHGFTEHIIEKRKYYHESTNYSFLKSFDSDASVDDEKIEDKKKFALLDLLIKVSREKSSFLTDLDIREEIDTFMFGGHDTTTIALSYLLMLLAEHKDIQDRVRNEINNIMKQNGQIISINLLQDLKYLDMCIKETLRLYPSAFIISRITGEDVKLQSYLIPAGTTIFLNIYGVHRDPNFWPNPEIFNPDRFLPKEIRNHHIYSYSYIPFSAGSRSCLGKNFAMLQMKAIVTPLIHNFYLEPIDSLTNLRINIDMMLRPAHPLRVKFVPIKEIPK